MSNRSSLAIGIISGILVAGFIIYALGFSPDSFGFWALYVQLEGCVIIFFYQSKLTFAKRTALKDRQA